jgi:hypothetical protein
MEALSAGGSGKRWRGRSTDAVTIKSLPHDCCTRSERKLSARLSALWMSWRRLRRQVIEA